MKTSATNSQKNNAQRLLRHFFSAIGSIKLALPLMILLGVLCGWATFIERDFGTTAAGQIVYKSYWFIFLEGVLGINILSAMLARFPWKKREIPFLCAHFGVLLLLVGAWWTFRYAMEGDMTITEGTSLSTAVASHQWSLDLTITPTKDNTGNQGKTIVRIPFSGGVFDQKFYSKEGWEEYVLHPALAKIQGNSVGQKISRVALRGHYSLVRLGANLTGKGKPRVLYSDHRLKVEQIDYLCPGQFSEEGDDEPFSIPFDKSRANEFYALLKVRVTLGEKETECWLRPIPAGISGLDALTRTIPGTDSIARIKLENREFDPGFTLHLKKFEARYEPGSTTPSSFSSLIHWKDQEGKEISDYLIRMNKPGKFHTSSGKSVWVYQSSFKGPFYPGSEEFESVVGGKLLPGESVPREKIYQSVFSLNYDPGRSLKNLGSMLTVLGVLLLIFFTGKKSPKELDEIPLSSPPSRCEKSLAGITFGLVILFSLFFCFYRGGLFDSDQTTGWKNWRTLPVWSGGREMPLETFARMTVREICGTDHPVISPDLTLITRLENGELSKIPPLDRILSEKSYSDDEKEEIKLWYAQQKEAEKQKIENIKKRLEEVFPQSLPRVIPAYELIFAWVAEPDLWRVIPFIQTDLKPADLDDSNSAQSVPPSRFIAPILVEQSKTQAIRVDKIQRGGILHYATKEDAISEGNKDREAATLERKLSLWRAVAFHSQGEASLMAGFYLDRLLNPSENPQGGEFSVLETLELSARRLKNLAHNEGGPTPFDDDQFELNQTVTIGEKPRTMEVLRLLQRIHLLSKIYPESNAPMNARLFSSLLSDLKKIKQTLHTHQETVFAKDEFSSQYRAALLHTTGLIDTVYKEVARSAIALTTLGSYRLATFADKKRLEKDSANGSDAMKGTPAASLSIDESGALAVYPFDPSFAQEEETWYWASIQTLLFSQQNDLKEIFFPSNSPSKGAGQLADILNNALEQYRSGPVALFKSREVFSLLPSIDRERNSRQRSRLNTEYLYDRVDPFRGLWLFAAWAFPLALIALALPSRGRSHSTKRILKVVALAFLMFAMFSAAFGGLSRAYITGWAPLTSMFETIVLLAFMATVVTILYAMIPLLRKTPPREIRGGAILLGSMVALLIGLLAYYNRGEFNPSIRPIAAVLRSNFWLAVHVTAIMASYALGVLAWGIALAILIRGLFDEGVSLTRPLESPLLSLLRWTVLLLTLGTILGAYWADRSWGRFWSWDPKEVWALVTLLVYLVVLHYRILPSKTNNEIRLARGGVLGAMAIIMTWYGLSFVFGAGGRHSYASGEATKTMIMYILIGLNLLIAMIPERLWQRR